MDDIGAVNLMRVDGGRIEVSSVRNGTTSPVAVLSHDSDGDASCFDMSPAEARALAALLLKHADRAEGVTK